jgi:hypothetical protein
VSQWHTKARWNGRQWYVLPTIYIGWWFAWGYGPNLWLGFGWLAAWVDVVYYTNRWRR